MRTIVPYANEDPLELLGRCRGYYKCVKDPDGKRLTPLVAYAGKYDNEHRWVGDEYVNFARAERHGPVMQAIIGGIFRTPRMLGLSEILRLSTGFCGAPEGGKGFAKDLASWNGQQYIFPEKKGDELKFDRHEPETGEAWWLVEDVCNNMSTTDKMIELIQKFGASVAGIICFLNRSPTVEHEYLGLPVVSLVRKQIPEYRQDNPFVKADVDAGNIVWSPKIQWNLLEKGIQASK